MKYLPEYKLWFPDTELRPAKMHHALTKYIDDSDYALSLIQRPKELVCIQAGGHIGFWPLHLAKKFKEVYTFEPDPPCYEALLENIKGVDNIYANSCALGRGPGVASFRYWSSRTAVSAMTELEMGGDQIIDVQVMPIDGFGIQDIGLIYLDIEGYEPDALRGAQASICLWKPIVVCEMLPKAAEKIKFVLRGMDYFPIANKFHAKCRDTTFMHKDDKRFKKCLIT